MSISPELIFALIFIVGGLTYWQRKKHFKDYLKRKR